MAHNAFALVTLNVLVLWLATPVFGREVDWRDGTFPLEPARIGEIALAKPKGWSVTQGSNGYHLRQPEGKAEILLSLGNTPDPYGWDFDLNAAVEKLVAAMEPIRVLEPAKNLRCLYRETIIVSRGEGTDKVVAVNVGKGSGSSWLLVGVLATDSEQDLIRFGGLRLLNTIAHSVSRVVGPVPSPDAVVGLWEDIVGRGFTKFRFGKMVGSASDGVVNTYALGANRKYQLRRDAISIGQALQGHGVEEETGTYETDGATIVFHPQSCTSEWYELSGARTMRRPCNSGEFPQTASVRRASAGREVVLVGEGLREGRNADCDCNEVRFTPIKATQ